jgi:predicted transcriptional regulator
MRTTVDLPDDLHELARQLAHDERRSMSEVIADLIRRGIAGPAPVPTAGPLGLPVVSVGRVVTADDVRSLDDE